jgi:hypothetical protein
VYVGCGHVLGCKRTVEESRERKERLRVVGCPESAWLMLLFTDLRGLVQNQIREFCEGGEQGFP